MKNLADIEKTGQRGRLTWLRDQYERQIPNDSKYRCTWDTVVELDPTSSKKYLDWILRQVVAKKLMVEDHYKVPAALNEFIRCASMIKDAGLSTDLNAYESIPALATVLSPFKALLSPAEVSKKEREEIDSETAVLIDSPELLVVSPKTERASCFWGKGTQWCTAATESRNAFKQYTDGNGDGLFIIIDRLNGNKKYQIDKEGQFCNEFDEPLKKNQEVKDMCRGITGRDIKLDASIACFEPTWVESLGISDKACLESLKYRPTMLNKLPFKTNEFLMSALNVNGCTLEFIRDQSTEQQLAAVKQNPWSISYAKSPSEDICLEAVRKKGSTLKYIENQTTEICLEAVKQEGSALQYAKIKSKEIVLEAIKQDGHALSFVPEQTPEVCMAAVTSNGSALSYVREQTEELCLAAVAQRGIALLYVKNITPEVCMAAIRSDPKALSFIGNPSKEMIQLAQQVADQKALSMAPKNLAVRSTSM